MSEKVQITTNVARENRLWRAGKRAKLNLVAVQVDALSIVPFPLLYFIKSKWYLLACLTWVLVIVTIDKFKMTPIQGLKRVRAIIAGKQRFITRYSNRQRRFTNGN
ncbi:MULTISPECIES: hypothetical protein [Alteromonas]|jgi:hypothetical protein|uniref:hypothetical protein n=1 Tax=Alteromonas TaxID=226 RepID=UPI0008594265|nr:hypothetical protein [Alteromonas macleodii]|tara:strand:- start:259 stop:576 length:318 start_codon:yes stop_codon:yes gene_type:complete